MTSPPDAPPELPLVIALGEAFKREGMPTHVELLRGYYRARIGKGATAWTDAMVLDWLRILRIPPHDAYYPVQPRASQCRACEEAHRPASKYTRTVWPGGALCACMTCGAAWLELREPA